MTSPCGPSTSLDPSIPRLPLRSSRGGSSNRGRKAGGPDADDDAIRATDNDAAVARASAARAGYIDDPFVSRLLQAEGPSRPPLINVGTHHRTFTIDALTDAFLDADFADSSQSTPQKRNVLSLGAGSDSRFWRLRRNWDSRASGSPWPVGKWVEVDFAEPSRRKAARITADAGLAEYAGGSTSPSDASDAGSPSTAPETTVALDLPLISLLACDLRSSPSSLVERLRSLAPVTEPLLIIAELVFAYMQPSASSALLSALIAEWSGPGRGGIAVVTYEMLYSGDSFGKVMVQNLKSRNLTLAGLAANPDVSSQSTRLLRAGCSSASALDLKAVRQAYIPRGEMARIAKLELLDEVEELELVLEHYSVACGVRPGQTGEASWKAMTLQPRRDGA